MRLHPLMLVLKPTSKRTGKITVVVPNHANIADIEKTILHEAVAHHGLRELFGEEFDNMIESIFMQVDEATRLEIMRKSSKRGWDYVTATEEYLASMAEDTNFEHVKPSVWQRIKQFFGEMLSAVGLHRAELTDNDLRYILWRSYENLKKGGKRGVFDVAEDVAMQYRLKVGNYAEQTEVTSGEVAEASVGLDEVNERFNDALQQQIDGTLPKGYVYDLGMPSSILLSTGIPNLPIQLNATRLKEKATSFGHDFDLSEVKNLVKSLQHPMAIFKYGDERKAQNIVIELQQGDKNFIVGLSLHPTINGRELHINSIRNVFPKDNAEWLNWISQGKLLRVNKEKVQNLINQQRTILADVDYLDLDSIAKIIKDFENRKLNDDVIYPIVENGSLQWVDKEKALNYLHHSALRAEALSSSRLNSAAKIIKDFENRKLNDDVIYPIVENGSLQWVDKEKGLNWLSSVSHYAQQEIDNQALNSATKIVENFENRKLNDDVIYRDNDSAENTDARSIYEQRVRRSMFQTQEALQDSMLGLKEAMESITKSEGKKIERVLSLETKGLFLFYHFYFTCISNV